MEIISFDPERQGSEKSFIHRYSLPCVSLRDGIDSAHTIVVFDNQMAVIEADGTVCDFLGPGRYPVSAEFFPLLAEASRKSGLDVSVDLFFLQTDISWSMYFGTSNGPMYIIDPVCLVEYRLYLFGRFTLVPADLPVFFQKVRENGSCDAAAVERALTSCLNMINVRLKQNVARTIKEQGISVQALSYPLLSRYIRTTIEDDRQGVWTFCRFLLSRYVARRQSGHGALPESPGRVFVQRAFFGTLFARDRPSAGSLPRFPVAAGFNRLQQLRHSDIGDMSILPELRQTGVA